MSASRKAANLSAGHCGTTAHPLKREWTQASVQDPQMPDRSRVSSNYVKLFEDTISSRKADRPGLTAALDYLRPNGRVGYQKCLNRCHGRGMVVGASGLICSSGSRVSINGLLKCWSVGGRCAARVGSAW